MSRPEKSETLVDPRYVGIINSSDELQINVDREMINPLLLHSPSTRVSSSRGSTPTWRSTNQRTDTPT